MAEQEKLAEIKEMIEDSGILDPLALKLAHELAKKLKPATQHEKVELVWETKPLTYLTNKAGETYPLPRPDSDFKPAIIGKEK